MKKNIKFFVLVAIFVFLPFINVHAESKTVNTQDELKAAIADVTVDTIVLGQDFETTEEIIITREVIIDGASHIITYSGTTSANVLQFHNTTSTLKDITLTGADTAIFVNGSIITLEGTINVSGNNLAGIKIGRDAGVTDLPDIMTVDVTIVNTGESALKPTVLIDIPLDEIESGDDSSSDEFDVESWPFKGAAYVIDADQIHFYLSRANVPTGDNIVDISDDFLSKDNVADDKKNEEAKKEDNTIKENPNTYDNFLVYISLAVVSFIALGYSYAKATSK